MISSTGNRALPPFMNIIQDKISDDFLVMGSVPMASDAANVMVTEPYNSRMRGKHV